MQVDKSLHAGVQATARWTSLYWCQLYALRWLLLLSQCRRMRVAW